MTGELCPSDLHQDLIPFNPQRLQWYSAVDYSSFRSCVCWLCASVCLQTAEDGLHRGWCSNSIFIFEAVTRFDPSCSADGQFVGVLFVFESSPSEETVNVTFWWFIIIYLRLFNNRVKSVFSSEVMDIWGLRMSLSVALPISSWTWCVIMIVKSCFSPYIAF